MQNILPNWLKTAILVTCSCALHMPIDDQQCTKTDHWVDILPFWKSVDGSVHPCSYAGTLDANPAATHHNFYWLFPNEDPSAPITIWLNGGPGASSIFSSFLLNGPLRIAHYGTCPFEYEVYLEPAGSWADITHMMYLDQPVGTGFSWGEPLLTTMDDAAQEFIYFMHQFYKKYPSFVGKDLILTGESYAGKYLARFGYELLLENERLGFTKFNLKAELSGDPYISPIAQRLKSHVLPEALNIIDQGNMPQIAALQRNCVESLSSDSANAAAECTKIVDYIEGVSGGAYSYDIRIFAADYDIWVEPVTSYFTTSGLRNELYHKLHVSDSTKEPIFQMGSSRVGDALAADSLVDYTWYI